MSEKSTGGFKVGVSVQAGVETPVETAVVVRFADDMLLDMSNFHGKKANEVVKDTCSLMIPNVLTAYFEANGDALVRAGENGLTFSVSVSVEPLSGGSKVFDFSAASFEGVGSESVVFAPGEISEAIIVAAVRGIDTLCSQAIWDKAMRVIA